MKIVYTINERDGRKFWTRIGVAFENRDGSMNVKLESFPLNGELHIREQEQRQERQSDDRREEDYVF